MSNSLKITDSSNNMSFQSFSSKISNFTLRFYGNICVCVCVIETHILYRLKAFPIFISVVSVSSGMGKIRGNIIPNCHIVILWLKFTINLIL